jgi:hypothetical protein
MAKIFRLILNACGVALGIVDETCRLDSQAQRMLVDGTSDIGASDIEVAMANDDGNPAARETGQNRGMLYVL